MLILSLIVLVSILYGDSKQIHNQGSVTAYFDNSISSTLGNVDLRVESTIKQISLTAEKIFFFDNSNSRQLDKNSLLTIPSEKSQTAKGISAVFKWFKEEDAPINYLFSDLQSLDINELQSLASDSSSKYQIFITEDLNTQRNVSVDSLYIIPNQDNLSELSVYVEFSVMNLPKGSIVVKLMQNDRQLSSIVKDVSELDFVRFDISKDNFGHFQILIAGDDVHFDNEFNFVVEEKVKPVITIISSSSSTVLEKVFDNDDLFNVTTQNPSNLDFDKLMKSDLVIFDNQYEIPKIFSNKFSSLDFVVFPSDSIDTNSYADFLNLNLESANSNQVEVDVESSHPILRGVFEEKVRESVSSSFVELLKISGNFEPIVNFRNGNPFFLKKNNVYLFNTLLIDNDGGFHASALFLPILYQIAFESSGGLSIPYSYPGDKSAVLTLLSDSPLKLIGENYEVIPSFNLNDSEVVWEVPIETSSGKYFLVQEEDTLQPVAVNIPKEESLMQAPKEEELRRAFSDLENVEILQINDSNSTRLASSSKLGIWKYALILVLFLIMTETVLHRYLK